MIDTMHGHWHDWRESIPRYWGRCGIAVCERIKEYDERMEKIAKEVHPEVSLLKQVKGVGTQIALTYVLTIEDPYRFLKSREVGCFLGLRPGRRNSGESEPQKRISKEGDRYL